MKDDGIGAHIVHELEKLRLPEGVKVLDAGTKGLGLVDLMRQAPKAVFVDAVDMGKKPGAVKRFTPQEIESVTDRVNFSLHEVGLPQVLHLASALGISPEVVIFGIQPKDLGRGIGLSPELKRAVPNIVESVLSEVDNFF
jgi:hydrogenase maturation protease